MLFLEKALAFKTAMGSISATGMVTVRRIVVGRTSVSRIMRNVRMPRHSGVCTSNAFTTRSASLAAAAPPRFTCVMISHSAKIQLGEYL